MFFISMLFSIFIAMGGGCFSVFCDEYSS